MNGNLPTNVAKLTARLRSGSLNLLASLIVKGKIGKGKINLSLNAKFLAQEILLPEEMLDLEVTNLTTNFSLRRRGIEAKLIIGEGLPQPDPVLVRALVNAHRWTKDLRQGVPLGKLAVTTGHSDSYIRARILLAFLSPTIQSAILKGNQPTELTLEKIVRKPVPLDWAVQEQLYGFAR